MGITLANQDKLEKLPIPDLQDTCKSYLEVLEPLQTPSEHIQTEEAIKQFLESSGPILQERLMRYAEPKTSYIEQFWYDSYLSYDNPVVLNLNPFFLLEDSSLPIPMDQVTRASHLTTSSLRFIREYRREVLAPDTWRGNSLCMYQYSRLFGSARIPTANGCVMETYNNSKHIAVICRSQFYWFDVLDDNNDLIMSEEDIALNFKSIIEDAENTPITEAVKGAVGVLTTENRRVWANIRDGILSEGASNSECLKKVDWALFIVCLDQASPETLKELAQNMLCGLSQLEKGVQVGTLTNRWYDKLQIIVTKNAKAGVNFEHTGVDGHTVLRFVSDIYTDTILRFAKSINGNSPSIWNTHSPDPAKRDPASFGHVCTTPRKLEWKNTPELLLAMRFAETRLADLIHQNEFEGLEIEHYGMNLIKEMGFSPDAFVQMAFQAAYYSLYGRVECTYEPAMTKRYLHGRTESIRTVSMESLAFVRKFCEDAPASQKLEFLKRACEKHTARTAKCSKGMGQDRHLYALFCIWKRYLEEAEDDSHSDSSDEDLSSMPAIFADSGWDKLGNALLSTSNCGNPSLKLFGFGPTSPDGFGLGYIIKANSVTVCASSKHRQTKRFLETLDSVFFELKSLWKQASLINKSLQKLNYHSSNARSYESLLETKPHLGRTLTTPSQPPSSKTEDEPSYLLGGYGYFDVGDYESRTSRAPSPDPTYRRSATSKKEIGRKLRLAEY
jgi:carnitine O-acetyltransferase